MLVQTIDNDLLSKFSTLIDKCHNVVLTCHMSPDGDAIGAVLGFSSFLQSKGKETKVITPDKAPDDMSFLPGFDKILAYSHTSIEANHAINTADLIVCLDYNGLNRIAEMAVPVNNAKCPKIMIDHHLHPDNFCDLTISYPEMTSTCELLYRVLYHTGNADAISKETAECIYTGMMTDTGNFSYNSNKADLYIIVADLVAKGIDKDNICKLAMRTSSENRLRLNGYAVAEKMSVYPESRAALIVLDKSDLKRFNYKKGDTEDLVNTPLAIPEVIWSTFFREETDFVKVSMRSEGDFTVNNLCKEYFNGGGHANAAGGEFRGTLDEAINIYNQLLKKFKQSKH